jgi:Na+/H+ antiporter NhaD/arsenite permease-like protein
LAVGGWLALGLFAALYVLLAAEWMHRALAALLAAVAVVAFGLLTPAQARAAVDFNTILLLVGMMVLAALLEEAGLFRHLAWLGARWGGGSPRRLLVLFIVLTAALSAVLPNMTVVLVMAPVMVSAAEGMGWNPVPLLVLDAIASNIGGMATLIGDPPNILIGTAATMTFGDFLRYLLPPAAILTVLVVSAAGVGIKPGTSSRRPLPTVETSSSPALVPLLAVTAATLAGFLFQPELPLLPLGLIAVLGAAAGILVVGADVERVLAAVDWSTVIFFVALFIVVGAMVHQGVVEAATHWVLGRRLGPALPLVLLAGTALLSAFLDNLPVVAAMIPLVERVLAGEPRYGQTLWIALAIGAAVGGNATLYGAAANVVAASLAKARGYRLSFREWARVGVPLTAGLLLVSAIWVAALGGWRL